MGYTTDFQGEFKLDRPLKAEHAAFLRAFADTRRMARDGTKLPTDPIRHAAELDHRAEYFVSAGGDFGQASDPSVLDYNSPPADQPGLWCKWEPNEDGTAIRWNGREKFYRYVEWLRYLIVHFLSPWGYDLNGDVSWQGEERGDTGVIRVRHSRVTT